MRHYVGLVVMICGMTMMAFAQSVPPIAGFILGSGYLTENGLGKGTPLPDGTEVQIYWDQNANGPDEKDTPPQVGEKGGDVNFNMFKINSAIVGGAPGQFFTDPMMTVIGFMPDPPLYYLRVCLEDRQLISKVVKLIPGLSDYEMDEWTVVKTPCKEEKKEDEKKAEEKQ